MSRRKSCDESEIVAEELRVLQRRPSDPVTDDGDSIRGGYTSSLGSSRDLNGRRVEGGKSLKPAKL
jgi:hypothetical protein